MKKVTLTTIAIWTMGTFFAQSHEAGDIVLDLNYEIGLGLNESGEVDIDGTVVDSDFDGQKVNSGGIRFDVQYGFTDLVSAGAFARFGTQVTKFDDINEVAYDDLKRAYTEAGIELRVHALNVDNFNIYIAPNVGIASAKDDASDESENLDDYKYSGITYGLGLGFNFYFSEDIGADLRVGYGGRAYKSDQEFNSDPTDPGQLTTREAKYGLAGLDAGLGILVKF